MLDKEMTEKLNLLLGLVAVGLLIAILVKQNKNEAYEYRGGFSGTTAAGEWGGGDRW